MSSHTFLGPQRYYTPGAYYRFIRFNTKADSKPVGDMPWEQGYVESITLAIARCMTHNLIVRLHEPEEHHYLFKHPNHRVPGQPDVVYTTVLPVKSKLVTEAIAVQGDEEDRDKPLFFDVDSVRALMRLHAPSPVPLYPSTMRLHLALPAIRGFMKEPKPNHAYRYDYILPEEPS
jgi:hypothetical protein